MPVTSEYRVSLEPFQTGHDLIVLYAAIFVIVSSG